jgi:WD40 repeat protein
MRTLRIGHQDRHCDIPLAGLSLLSMTVFFLSSTFLPSVSYGDESLGMQISTSADEVLSGVRAFYDKTARPDGSFAPGIDPEYRGMSDSAYSDLAPVTYAVTIHKTLGWKLPHEAETIKFLLSRQREDGAFFNVAGTVDPASAEGRTYNTTQALVALRALGVQPRHNPLPVFEQILKQDYKSLPAYSTSFFPLAYLCYGKPIPDQADRAIRATMIQDATGYLNDHIAATFHASHYYRLVGEPTPKAYEMISRILRDQKADGSWLLNMPSRDRHATFDAVFTLRQEGHGREDCRTAIERAATWALSCRNPDGGFGHYPGSTSDADAVYFQVGTLVMAGYLKASDPLPSDPHLLSWGHLMPVRESARAGEPLSINVGGWVGSLAFSPDGRLLATTGPKDTARLWDATSGREIGELPGHSDHVQSISFSPDGKRLVTGSYDRAVRIWDIASITKSAAANGGAGDRAKTGAVLHVMQGHGGAIMSAAFSPDGSRLATASLDGSIKLWDPATGQLCATLVGHQSWVNSVSFDKDSRTIVSGSSDGTVRVWSVETANLERTIDATNAEVRSIALSFDGKWVAAGLRYGGIRLWDAKSWREQLNFQGHESDVWSLAFAPDAQTLVSANGDWNRPGQIKLWRVPSGEYVGSLQHTGEVLSVAISPDGKRIAAGGGDGTVHIWKWPLPSVPR